MNAVAYLRLSLEEREEISRGLALGQPIRQIARSLHRAPSTISRDVRRSRVHRTYRGHSASASALSRAKAKRKGRSKIREHPALERFIRAHLHLAWSPTQISRELRIRYPQDETMRISHEAIYQYIYVLPRGELKRRLIAGLRQEHKYRRKHKNLNRTETRGKLADMLSIEERPKEVEDRIVPGHWEGDLILGKHKVTALGTLVERTTRFTVLVPLKERDAISVRKAFAYEMRRLPASLTKTLTYDQGKEMSGHRQFTVDTGIQVYFAHPSSPWERGTNENTNGLIRQFFPKGTDFSTLNRRQIKRVQDLLNGRPRQTLGFQKPINVFNKLVALES